MDGTFLEASPTDLYAEGAASNATTIMAGFTRDEGTLYALLGMLTTPPVSGVAFQESVEGILQTLNASSDLARDVILQEYIDWTIADDPEADYWRSAIDVITDTEFACPTDTVLRHHVAAGTRAYEYYMTHVPSMSIFSGFGAERYEWLGAGHAEDIPLVFGWGFNEILKPYFTMTDEENELSIKVIKFWTNFAKSGDPSKSSADAAQGKGQDAWPEFTVPGLHYKELSTELGEGRGVRAGQCSFWKNHFPRVVAYVAAAANAAKNDATDADAYRPRGGWREAYAEWKTELREWRREFSAYREGLRGEGGRDSTGGLGRCQN